MVRKAKTKKVAVRRARKVAAKLGKPRQGVVAMVTQEVTFERGFWEAAQAKLEERGVSFSDFASLQLRALVNSSRKPIDLNDKMPFGKFEGAVVEQICRMEPRYISWLMTKTPPIQFTAAVEDLISEVMDDDLGGALSGIVDDVTGQPYKPSKRHL